MSNPIQDLQKQTFRYYYQDGLVELAVGILFLVIGIDTYVISSLPTGTPLSIVAWIALPILTIAGIFGVQRIVKNLKEQHVHPRTGYIQYAAKPNRYRWLIVAFAFFLAISVILLPYEWLQKGSVTGGMILCVILASIGAQVDLKRLIWIGGSGVIFGLLFGFLPLTDNASLAATFAAVGSILVLSGSLAFRKYLANNPLPQEAANA
jgi:hypothetical protein